MRYLSDVLKEVYGEKVYKISLRSGCTCPNRDGTIGTGGCTFCSAGGSGEFAAAWAPVDAQIEEAKARIRKKTDARRFIAYYQAYTNTYGDPARLRTLYEETIRRDDIAILSLATRPDCLGPEIMQMLADLARIKPVWVELGLQTAHDRTAERIRRGYPRKTYEEARRKLKAAGITVITHVIFGLPGETREDMLETIHWLANYEGGTGPSSHWAQSEGGTGPSSHWAQPEGGTGPSSQCAQPESGQAPGSGCAHCDEGPVPPSAFDGVKLQMLHILKGTALGNEYERHPFPLLSLEEYADLVAESAQILPERTVLHRMTGDAPGKLLIAPEWTRNKKKVLNTIRAKL